jgi:hypothetical protein
MSTLVRSAIVAAAVLGLGVHAAAQRPAGSIAGVVMTDDTPPQPARRATVSLVSADLGMPLSTVTDDDGRFSFAAVPAGHYAIVASKPSYVGAFYGSTRPGRGPGVPVAVPAGAVVDGLTLTLTRGSVIAGTLHLPSGERALNMPVIAIAVDTASGTTRWRYAGGRTATDDRGEYRIFGLPAGEYLVIAQPSGLIMGSPTGANDTRQTTESEVSWAEAVARRQSGGLAGPTPVAPSRGPTLNYSTVFYPGTPDASLASPVRVGPGEERSGMDFALTLVPTARVSGTIVDRSGQPIRNVTMTLDVPDDRLSLAGIVRGRPAVQSGADGSFTIPAVAPGRYRLIARAAAGAAAEAGIWALHDLVVDGREISNVALQLEPGLIVSGRLAFEAASTPAPGADDLVRARVSLTPASADGLVDVVGPGRSAVSAPVAADGSFTVGGLVPGAYRLTIAVPGVRMTASAAAAAWSLASITHAGADIADRAFELRPGDAPAGIVATFTDRPTELSGTLSDQSERPAPGYPIVVFTTDRAEWRRGSRRVAVARPATDGSFRLIGLPPGTYHMAAVVSLDAADLDEASFLEQLVAASVTVTLDAGSLVVQHLRMSR